MGVGRLLLPAPQPFNLYKGKRMRVRIDDWFHNTDEGNVCRFRAMAVDKDGNIINELHTNSWTAVIIFWIKNYFRASPE